MRCEMSKSALLLCAGVLCFSLTVSAAKVDESHLGATPELDPLKGVRLKDENSELADNPKTLQTAENRDAHATMASIEAGTVQAAQHATCEFIRLQFPKCQNTLASDMRDENAENAGQTGVVLKEQIATIARLRQDLESAKEVVTKLEGNRQPAGDSTGGVPEHMKQ